MLVTVGMSKIRESSFQEGKGPGETFQKYKNIELVEEVTEGLAMNDLGTAKN